MPAPSEPVVRRILLSPDTGSINAGTTSARGVLLRVRRLAERWFPARYDLVRQLVLRQREAETLKFAVPRAEKATGEVPPAGSNRPNTVRAVLIAMHWFELGGAERWALETVRLAKEAGLLPVVIADRLSPHPWIVRSELDGAIILPLTFPLDDVDGGRMLLRTILDDLDVRGVWIHHSAWMYEQLPWLRAVRPDLPVIDTLHIIEDGSGGFAASGARYDSFIDIHHVISPQLERWLRGPQRVAADRIRLAPLVGLTTEKSRGELLRRPDSAMTIAFVGRFSRQKRPYLFLALVRKLTHDDAMDVRAVMVGGGELEPMLFRLIRRWRLGDTVEVRPENSDVSRALSASQLLVVSSSNEGLTLTTLEAIGLGVPVISADVGSQRTLVGEAGLVGKNPRAFLAESAALIHLLADNEETRRTLWLSQAARAEQFGELPSATSLARKVLSSWAA